MSQRMLEKLAVDLLPSDFEMHPVWTYTREDKGGDWLMTPILDLPVKDLRGKVIGVPVTLANGKKVSGSFSNVTLSLPRRTEHFLSLSIAKDTKWFHLARYWERRYEDTRGPMALAKFLDMDIDDVFPIAYDLRPYVPENAPAAGGKVFKEPRERLTREELFKLPAFTPDEDRIFKEKLKKMGYPLPEVSGKFDDK